MSFGMKSQNTGKAKIETENEEIIDKLRQWLSDDGIQFFREIKEKYGTVNACWVEGSDDSETQFRGIPHPVHFREGMRVRNFLRRITGNSWTSHEYDDHWVRLVEEAIK